MASIRLLVALILWRVEVSLGQSSLEALDDASGGGETASTWQAAQDGLETATSEGRGEHVNQIGDLDWQVLRSSSLKIPVLADGGLGQPFYRSHSRWTKLTYGSKHMDYAIKVDGRLAKISGDLDVVDTSPSVFTARSQLTLNGVPQATLLRSYSFLGDGMVFNISFSFKALTDLTNLQVYLGTSDDWIGSSDHPRKDQGRFHNGEFRPEPHGKVLRVQSSDESVFAFSSNPESHAIILQHYGNFADVYAATMSDMSSSSSDGAYGIYVPCGNLARGETKQATIFYAAAGAANLGPLMHQVQAAESAAAANLVTQPGAAGGPGVAALDLGAHAVHEDPSEPSNTAVEPELEAEREERPEAFLQSEDLKIGIMHDGSLHQPFYYSQSHQKWTKLTYGTKKLDYAVKVNGRLASFGDATIHNEHEGKSMEVRSQLLVDDVPQGEVLRSYSFVGEGMVLKITFSFSALTPLSDLKVWLGTSDDWIGTSDRPTKEQGGFHSGEFIPSEGGKILRVQSGQEAVFVFSPNPNSEAIILQHYGNWPRVYASERSDLSKSTSDGSYAIYVPLGAVAEGETKEATIFYAASGASQLQQLARVSEQADEVAELAESTMVAFTTTEAWTTLEPSTTTIEGVVLQTDFLKIAVLEDGSLGQPFYYSARLTNLNYGTGQIGAAGGWTKLTYGDKHLDSSIKVDGSMAHLSGEAATESSSGQSLAMRSQIMVNGIPKAEVLRSYGFTGDGMVLNITYSFTALSSLSNLEVWLGTSDDWIGSSDRPTKEQGAFQGGSFVPTPHGQILRVQSGEEAVFVFSPDAESHAIILQHYGDWPAVTASTKSDLSRSASDGAYAIYVPLGALAAGQTKKATVFYAAAAASHLSHLLRVTEAVVASERPTTTTTSTTTSTTFATQPTTPTTTTVQGIGVLQSEYLRIAVLEDGSLGQPFYMSDERGWTKLTYANQKLDYSIKAGGKLAAVGGEAAVERSVGHSALATRSQMSLDGIPKAEVLRSYSFLGDGMILNVTYSFNALTSISDLEVWLGTSDDWIGTSDRPTKEQGSLALGQFVPEQHGQILQVKSGEESVIVFSPNSESHAIILEHYGNWPAVSASTKSDVARSTSDGAYAIYVPLGSMEPGETKSATIFYAAAGANHLEELLRVTEAVKQISTTTTTTSSTSWTLPTTTTTTLPYVLQSPYLKLGLLADGGLGQPFYKSQLTGWTKLTYDQMHLKTTVKIDGDIADLGGASTVHFFGPQSAMVREELMVDGLAQAELQRSYGFTGDGLVFQANFTVKALKPLRTVEVWFGTSDDWIGSTDRPLKQQGHFVETRFEPNEHGHILRIHSGDENVFVFSTNENSHAIIRAEYGRWSLIHAATHSELSTSRSDGAYGIYVPLGPFQAQDTQVASFFYAAAEEARLADLLRHASAADQGKQSPSTTVFTLPSTTLATTSAPPNMLETSFLKFKLLDEGGLGQPFYYSPHAGWTKLTYANKSLDCSVKVDGDVVDISSARDDVKWWDYQNAMATTPLQSRGGPSAMLTRSYGFKQMGMIFSANFTFTALRDLDSVEVWLGTSDDWVGITDQPSKIQGDFGDRGTFKPERDGDVLHVYSGAESMLMFSPNELSQSIILRHYGRWHEMEASTKSALHQSSTDGAYGIYVPLGKLKAGETKSAVFYYGASPADQLTALSRAASALKVHKKIFRSDALLVWDIDRCNAQKANASVDCDFAHQCYDLLWAARSACRVMLVNTMTIAELKGYICGNFTCSSKARQAKDRCERMYPNDLGWLQPVHHYSNRYCGSEGHHTDLINDHDTCEKSQEPIETAFCKTVRECYKGFADLGVDCPVDVTTMATMQQEMCSTACRTSISEILGNCGHYRVVRDSADVITAYQRYFQCDSGASSGKLSAEASQAKTVVSTSRDFWQSKAATYLTSSYEHCNEMGTSSTEKDSEACSQTVDCYDKLSEAVESCRVIWLPTMTVSEVSKYVCSGSVCHGHALHLKAECRHYHRVDAVLRPVVFYQEKYCPSWEGNDTNHFKDPDLVNDLYLCTLRQHKRQTKLCNMVINCNEQMSAVDRECSGSAGSMEEAVDLVCSDPCRTFIERASMYCADYPYLIKNLEAYKAYQAVFECGTGEAKSSSFLASCIRSFRVRILRRILRSASSTTGAFLLTSLVALSLALLMLRSISLRWHCPPPRMGYECLADDEPHRWEEEMSLTSRLDEDLLLLA